MTYKDAWEIIQFKHCEDTCDFGQMEDCQGERCEYYMALKALNAQYYAEGNVWTKPKDEPQPETKMKTQNSNLTFEKRTMRDCYNCKRYETEEECVECHYESKDEPQTKCQKCKSFQYNGWYCVAKANGDPCHYEPKGEPQTDCAWKKGEDE